MNVSTVVNEFECHHKCLRNNSCKSFNVRPGADISKRLCELNNKTRKMTPESQFRKMKGSSYYGPVKVSSTDWTSAMAFHLTNKEALTVPCSVVKYAERGRREHRRTGRRGEGGCSPPKFWATQIFWAARENLGKASFQRRFHVFLLV